MTNPNNKHIDPNIEMVGDDFVCPKENFEINLKMFHSDAPKVIYKCEFDDWSPNESMR